MPKLPPGATPVVQGVRRTEGGTSAATPVKSADRAIDVLELLAAQAGSMTLSEVHRHLGAPKSSLHGLLQTLVARGWVETDERGTSYGIGLRALQVGVAYVDRDPVVQAATQVLVSLRRELEETVQLGRIDGADIVYLASRESQHHLRVASRIGRRVPAHSSALGKALLATMPWAEVDRVLPRKLSALTRSTVSTRKDLRAELEEIEVRGWSEERGQGTPGLGCLAVAIPVADGPSRDAISCSLPLVRMTEEHIIEIVDNLARAVIEIEARTNRSLR